MALKKFLSMYRYPLAGLLFIGLLALLTSLRQPSPLMAALDQLTLALRLADRAIAPPVYARSMGIPLGQEDCQGSGEDPPPIANFISVAKSASTTVPQVGQEFIYILNINGSIYAGFEADVAIWDALPSGLETTGPVTGAGGVSVGVIDGSSVVSGTVYSSNGTLTIYIPVKVSDSLSPGSIITNTASFTITPRNNCFSTESVVTVSQAITVQPPQLLAKTVTPSLNVPYHGLVTYTLVLSNPTSASDPAAVLTDTLPAQVDFARWVGSPPAGVAVNNDEITWSGALAGSTAVTFTFQATHTGVLAETVNNTAQYSTTTQTGSSTSAGFVVATCSPVLTVQNSADSGPGSLRQDIADVCAGGTIDFAGDMTIYLDSSLMINKAITITGHGHAVTISGDSGHNGDRNVRVFYISAIVPATLTHLSIVSGTNSGGGIYNAGTLTVQNSTFSDNWTTYPGGGIYNAGTLTLQNSTFSGNEAGNGGIYSNGTLRLDNTIIANSSSGGDCHNDGSVSTHGYNLIESTGTDACNLTNGVDGNLIGVDPLLGKLGSDSGNTPTFPLLGGSPAINAGSACLSTDQRGIARPQGAACDIGAFELASAVSLGKTVTPAGAVPYHGLVTYTLVLSNTGVDSDPTVVLTDTLPAQVNFARWIGAPPSGAGASNDQITWSGALSGSTALTFTFQATHTGAYAETVNNTAQFSASVQTGSDEAAFTVEDPPLVSLGKTVTPAVAAPYRGLVTYTLVLSNTGSGSDPAVVLTDTLPAQVDFAGWVGTPPSGAAVSNDQITWSGALAGSTALTFTFQAIHTGTYAETVTNTAQFKGAAQTGRAGTGFTVVGMPWRSVYLPIVVKSTP